MKIHIDNFSDVPIYLQIAHHFTDNIKSGRYSPGHKLPTVRDLSKQTGASQGTINHAYDILEQMGAVEKKQGKGTFVASKNDDALLSKKDQAMQSIDGLLETLIRLGFSIKEIRIFIDLKLREKEHFWNNIKIGAIDCSVEALSMMSTQLSSLANVDVYEYLLASVLDKQNYFENQMDIFVTTVTHHDDIIKKLPPNSKLLKLVMTISKQTVMQLARIKRDSKVSIICKSKRFAQIILGTCKEYCILANPIKIAYLDDTENVYKLISSSDQIILPENYMKFLSYEQVRLINNPLYEDKFIFYNYQIDKGSFMYIEQETQNIYFEKTGI